MNFLVNNDILESKNAMLFIWIEEQIQNYIKKRNLQKSDLINLGIGDTCHFLPPLIKQAIIDSAIEMSEHVIGYGDETGQTFLKEAIIDSNATYKEHFSTNEVIVTEGIANSLSHLLQLFEKKAKIGVLSPSYPVYSTLLSLRGMKKIPIKQNEDLSFTPPKEKLDAIILCSPNNPTALAFSKKELQMWVDYAKENGSIILFDAAYNSFIFDDSTPLSIYEIEGAKEVAIEMKSFSKSHGFSALRLGYCIFPKEICYKSISLLPFCKKIVAANSNGVSYPIQKAGLAALSKEGTEISMALCKEYLENAKTLKAHLLKAGKHVIGAEHAPYLFMKGNRSSKEMFNDLLQNKNIITIPGCGFEADGFLRLSGFISKKTLDLAVANLTLEENHDIC